jgi:hypothetical protein
VRLVYLESPYAGDVEMNLRYARACMLDSIRRGESPIASHCLWTQCLDDTVPAERDLGMRCGFEWARFADATALYVDRGISDGMMRGVEMANLHRRPVIERVCSEELMKRLGVSLPSDRWRDGA